MNPARVELKLILDQAGITDISLETFSQRFNIQKRIFLVQVMGCDLGYRYGWYIWGPYCRELTADAFALRDELNDGERDHERRCSSARRWAGRWTSPPARRTGIPTPAT